MGAGKGGLADDRQGGECEGGGIPVMRYGTEYQVELVAKPVLALADLVAGAAKKRRRARQRGRRRMILRPGPETPRWNQLVATARTFLRRRGDKARLARILGVSRQRLHLLLQARTACPDAERTLLPLEWVTLCNRGQTMG